MAFAFTHTAGLWQHGFYNDTDHVWMERTDGGSSEGVLAFMFYNTYPSVAGPYHSTETRYSANHVHVNGVSGGPAGQSTYAGHFSSPGPYLGHHEHGENY